VVGGAGVEVYGYLWITWFVVDPSYERVAVAVTVAVVVAVVIVGVVYVEEVGVFWV